MIENFTKVLLVFVFFFVINDFFEGIEMIVFEDIEFEIFEFLVAEGTAMMSCDGLFDAGSAVDVSAACDAAVIDGVEADGALELVFELISTYSESVIIKILLFFDFHSIL